MFDPFSIALTKEKAMFNNQTKIQGSSTFQANSVFFVQLRTMKKKTLVDSTRGRKKKESGGDSHSCQMCLLTKKLRVFFISQFSLVCCAFFNKRFHPPPFLCCCCLKTGVQANTCFHFEEAQLDQILLFGLSKNKQESLPLLSTYKRKSEKVQQKKSIA